MSCLEINVGPKFSTLLQAADSRFENEIVVDQISVSGASETDRCSTYTQEAPAALDEGGRQKLQWLDRLPLGDRLGRYFSLQDTKDSNLQKRGWRKSVIIAAAATGAILLINIVFTIVLCVKSSVDSKGIGVIYSGNCDRVKRWDITLHLLINVLGTVLLAASSFTMQCLSSPTRSETDTTHAKRVSLEIGVASFTNLFYVRRWKVVIWLVLCLSTIPLHLLYNSTVFTTVPQNFFSVVMADESFLKGAPFPQVNDSIGYLCFGLDWTNVNQMNTSPTNVIETSYQGYKSGQYSSLTAAQCLDVYSDILPNTQRSLIVLVEQPTPSNRMSGCGFSGIYTVGPYNSVFADNPVLWNGSSVVGVTMNASTTVLTRKFWPMDNWMQRFSTQRLLSLSDLKDEVESTGTWPLGDFRVEGCQSENIVSKPCELQFLYPILYAVVTCNIFKFVCMCVTARYLWNQEEPILATVGDAVSSYLEHPDDNTKGKCLMDHRDYAKGAWKSYKPIYDRKTKLRLYFATTYFRWWATTMICTSFLVSGWIFWSITFRLGLDFRQLMSLGFGNVNSMAVITLEGLNGNVLNEVLVANAFQITLSVTYFLYNSVWTAQCGALEWASYIRSRKALRVTYPRGQQRSTYYLQLPYRYGVPLTLVCMLMHFLISQSVFLVVTQEYNWVGDRVNDGLIIELGYSPPAIFTVCVVGTVLILIQIAHACRPLDNRIPIHGNNSAVISAMCHTGRCDADELESGRSPSNATDPSGIALQPLMWGVTQYPNDFVEGSSMSIGPSQDGNDDGAGHCSFSADVVELPEAGKRYR